MKYTLAAVFTLLMLIPMTSSASWVQDGIVIAAKPADESSQVAIPDGAGGVFLAWMDPLVDTRDIYAQRLAPDGTEMWGAGGLILCNASFDQWSPAMAPDGAGGVMICWEDERNGGSNNVDIYAQRLDADGNNLWAANGIPICNAADRQRLPDVYFDGGAFLVAWQDERSGGLSDIYVQRVDLNGNALWTTNGVAAVNLTGSTQAGAVVVSDGAGGAIVAWDDNRSGSHAYVQSINFFGTRVWTVNGVAVDLASTQLAPLMMEDGAGGIFVAWRDAVGTSDVYLHRRDASGTEVWTHQLSEAAGAQYDVSMISDNAGGAIVAWYDDRFDLGDIYAQRVNAQGVALWAEYGTPVCSAAMGQGGPILAPDGAGGAVVAWDDGRFQDADIYAQRLTAYGYPMWATNGVPVSTAPSFQENSVIAGDGAGGAYVFWRDNRSGDRNLYAQRLEPNYGAWGQPEPAIASVTDDPHDQGGDVAVNWYASERDAYLHPDVTHYSVWRAIDAVAASSMATAVLADITPDFDERVIRVQSTAAGDYFWELVGTQIATRASGYSYLAPTRDDSTGTDPALHYFQVVAHTSNTSVFYVSDAVGGYSVDNLAPASPIMLVAQRVGNYVRLDWMPGTDEDEPDFATYAVYRDFGPSVGPEPVYYLSATQDTTLWDQTVDPDRPYYYIVTALDIHDNESEPSNSASVGATVTGIEDTPALTSLQVRSNVPNPFGGTTELQIGLPDRSDVSIDVFDVRGRRVARLSKPAMASGWGSVPFDGRDDSGAFLPSGVYFYRVSAGGDTMTRKFVIQR